MKRKGHLCRSLIIGAFLCIIATGALAHSTKSKQNNLVLLGVGETLQLAFIAECNVPQNTGDDSIVPRNKRSINFELVIEGSTAGIRTGEFIDSITMLDGTAHIVDVPANIGLLLKLSIKNVSGQGVCRLSSTGRLVGPSGETRGISDRLFRHDIVFTIPG